jgi:hypothetical protein
VITLSDDDLRVAAGNLLQAFMTRESTTPGTQARVIGEIGFSVLCEVAARAGLAESPGELELVIADVVEQLPPPGTWTGPDGGQDWTWLMQARFLLARRLLGRLGDDRTLGAAAA